MDFIEQIQALSSKIEKLKDTITTEEATKTAFIMPFIQALGYNIFDPQEVTPEFTADIGSKKGEKVDYAIFLNGHPIMLFECKLCNTDLTDKQAAQLRRYFHVTEARIGILTNGIVYRFYSDLEQTNVMDKRPFMEIDLLNLEEPLIKELKKLSKANFQLEEMLSTANELKYIREIKIFLKKQLEDPSGVFVRFFASQVYPGRLTQSVLHQFKSPVKKALRQFINEEINARLQSAMDSERREPSKEAEEAKDDGSHPTSSNEIVTTPEEWEAFYIIRAILRKEIPTVA